MRSHATESAMFSTGSKASTSAWRRKSPLRHTVRRRLRFEAMEARRLLAVYIVDSFSDSPNGLCAADDPLGNDTCTLRAAIIAANANPGPDEIRLAAGTYTLTRANSDQFGATEGSLDINDSLTLIGVSGNPADVIIDGNQLDSVFEVSAFSGGANIAVRFESITIRNGAGFSGGAISADSSVSLEINNSILENNRSTSESEGQGGAVATFGSLLIENSIITGNSANNGGGVAFESFAGATLTVRNSTFSANTARFPGEGGGLYAAGFEPGSSVTLFDTTFDQNSADDLGGGGAAITGIEDVVIGGSQFTANTTDSRGGGLSITDSGSVVINQTSFDANVAGPAGGAGLYISATNTLAIADSNFNNNQASGDGGGIFADGSAAAPISVGLTNVSFLQNRGSGGGGAALFFASLANITGGDFNGNVAEQSGGGGLQVRDSQTLTISDTNFVSNQTTVESDGGGGLLVRRVGPVQISGSSFGGNAAFGGQGGGLLYSDSESLTVQLSSFRNNSANRSGGGLRADGFVADDGSLGGPVSLTDVVLEGNTAGKEGGGAYLYLVGQVDVADSQFVVNTSGESGGGLYILDTGPVLIARSTFDGNIADGSGGGLSLLSDAEVEDSLFQNNLVRNPRDYGDAPESYLTLQASGGPSHGIIPGLSLGQTVDREADGQPSSLADGDDFADSFTVNDEDGVRLLAPLTPGADASFEVIVTNATQQSGFLQAWFDFNQNGTFDPEEQTVVDQTLAAGTNTVSISIPASAQPGALYTRWRYSLTPGLGSGGAADSGEVEDHLFDVTAQTSGPTAVDDTYEIPQGSVNTLLDVLNNDLFGSFGFGALFVSTPPQNGSVTSIDGQTFQYTPNAGFAGTDEFVYTLSDSQGNLSSAKITVNLTPGAASDDLVRYGIEFLDIITNQPISDIQAGNEFLARVTVEDLRPSFSQTGVFSGYLDLLYNSTLVAVAPDPGNPLGSDIRFGSEFQNFKTGNASTPGLIDEVGAFRTSQTPPTGPEGPVELFTVRLQAVSPGTATFAANPADNMASQTTLYGRETVLDVPELQLGISSLSILSGGGAGEGEGFTAALTGEFPVSFDQGGGGIAIAQDAGFQPTVSISGSTIRDNTAPLGGGIGSANANLTIIDSSILGNQATSAFGGGGGIGFSQEEILSNVSRVALLISGSTIDGNTSAADAAGVGIADADATITRSSVTNNSAVGRGGGIGIIGLANAPTVIIDATTISLNSASGVGGGIAAIDAGIDLLNVTISDNFAGDIGGGIAYANTDDRVTGRARFTTIATNTSVNPGSNVASGPAPLDFTSSLIAEPLMVLGTAINFAATPTGVSSSGSNLDSDGSGGFDQAGDLSGVDPLLGPLADNGGPVLTRALLAGSPAIDASGATPLESLVGDARGLVRFRDGDGDGVRLSDIGAFEVQETLSLGDLVFFDADNNGVFDPAVDSPIAGANLSLIRDANGNGVFDPGEPSIAQTQSDSSGGYLFTGLVAGDYIVQVDPSNAVVVPFVNSPLLNPIPSTANQPAADPDDDIDNDNNGFVVSGGGVFSRAITLMLGTEPDPLGGPPQSSANLTLDFGFVSNTILAVADAVQVPEDTPLTIDVLANDSDDVDSALTLVSVSTASSGTVQIIGNQIVYTPATGFTGPDSFTYVVTNPFAQQATGIVQVQVTPVAADVVDLAVSIEAFPQGEVVPGQLVDFSVFVQNLSDLTASGVVVDTTLSGNLIFQSGSSDFGSPSHLNNVVTFDGFSLPPGSSASFSITALLNPEASPPFEEFAFTEVSSDLNDPVTDNNFASVDLLGSSVDLHTLTTGSDDGGVVLQVDAFGGFGSARFSQSSLAEYNPLGPISAAGTVFNSYITVREGVSGPRESLQTAESSYSIDVPIAGNDTVATSRFRSDSFMVDLTQTVEPTFDAQGNRLGSRLVQSYAILNTTTDPRLLDLARYVDADLLFDGSLIDGGGLLVNSEGSLVLFTTDSGGTGASDTTFVGISASGGTTPLTDRFDLDDFAVLRERVLAGEPLRDLASGDLDGDGFINPGEEYDVAMALRNLLSLAAGQTLTYQTITHFGTRPQSIVPPQLAGDLVGRVFCDLDGDGIDDAGEGSAGVRVFLDRNGNRLFDEGGSNPEPFTFTDSDGNYVFVGLELPVGSTANVVTQNPPGCFPQAPEIGVTRVAMPTGRLSRAIETVDFNGNGQMDLIVANDLSNDLTVLINNNGNFSVGQTIPLGNRPQSLSAWRADSQSPAVIAVAAIGTPTTGGLVYVVENGTVRSFPSGDGPISVIVDDFNADGSPDFVTASFRSGTIVGRFSGQSEPIVLASANSPRSVTSAFINDDSAPDLVVVSSGFSDGDAYEVIVLLNDGNGNFSPARESIEGLGGVDATTADFNGDGRADIVVASYDGTVRIFGFDASGSAFEPLATVTTEKGIAAVAAADLNADGFVDLVIANARAETIELFLGNSDGFVRNRTVTGVPSPTGLAVTDFNADGLLDVAVANLFGSSNPFRLPSTATILELTVSERDVQLTSQTTQASFGFHPLPAQRTIRPAEAFPLDINRDGEVTAFDALLALNASQRVHSPASGEGESAATVRSRYKTDVNGDGLTTPLDALLVLNRMAAATRSAASPSGESLEVQALEVNALEGQTLEASDLATDVLEQIRRRRELAVDQLFSAASFLF